MFHLILAIGLLLSPYSASHTNHLQYTRGGGFSSGGFSGGSRGSSSYGSSWGSAPRAYSAPITVKTYSVPVTSNRTVMSTSKVQSVSVQRNSTTINTAPRVIHGFTSTSVTRTVYLNRSTYYHSPTTYYRPMYHQNFGYSYGPSFGYHYGFFPGYGFGWGWGYGSMSGMVYGQPSVGQMAFGGGSYARPAPQSGLLLTLIMIIFVLVVSAILIVTWRKIEMTS